ncbi:hypothetical protein [uncultured Ruminococcus sp.]|uniref:hypothetical protein n=1 Tax=uncultured Ruminococcus sp. TaxID=165186 RepID=UPI002609F5B6|nr:hypothetical protein [uncultured Ruminococcus sp.]
MLEHPLAIALILVTVLYLAAMVLLFWRYRIAMRQLSEKLRECREAEEAAKQEQLLAEEDDFTI